jgi:hypothetical protein
LAFAMTSLLSTAVLAAVPQLSYWRELAALSNKGDVNPPILAERSMFEDLGRGSCTNDARSNLIFSASLRPIDGNRADCEARCFNDTSCMAYSFGWQPQPNQEGHEHDEYWCETFSDCGSLKLAPIHPHLHEYGVRSYKRVMPTPVPTPTPTALPTVTPTGTPVVEFSDDPDDCVCCERTLAVMTRYCKTEMPMGDLAMNNFECAKEMGSEVTFINDGAHKRWTAIKSCKCNCDKKFAELRSIDCPMACKRLPFACPVCAPPPPPPEPPSPPPRDGGKCEPVDKPCCEGVLEALEKFCYSFEPQGEVVKMADPTHWDGGKWQPPASFDALCDHYMPASCEPCGQASCPKVLQLLARQFHPNLCDAIKTCSGFCDHQCPVTLAVDSSGSFGYVDNAFAAAASGGTAYVPNNVQQQQAQAQQLTIDAWPGSMNGLDMAKGYRPLGQDAGAK